MGISILLIEDDIDFARRLNRFLTKEGHETEHAPTGEEGIKLFRDTSPDLVLIDLKLPGISGLEAMDEIKQMDDQVPVFVMTAHGSIDTAVEAMKLGALDFITKPVDLDTLSMKIKKTRNLIGLKDDLNYLLNREKKEGNFENFIGSCEKMLEVYEKIKEVAKTNNTTVLVTGESGTGKELVAKAIHNLSERGNRPLMQIDCTSIPVALLESELFGHERGAFTGADSQKKGLLELADGGSLLLDEIGDMDLNLQRKFLRVLQERVFRRVGGTRDLRFDVRVIAATNQNLDRRSREGEFRQDLLYRLKVFQIKLPPLRERGNDMIDIAEAFIRQYAVSFRKPVLPLTDDARQKLLDYSFPGNVRELRNVIEQAMILAKDEAITDDLLSIRKPSIEPGTPVPTTGATVSIDALGENPLQTVERQLIREALKRTRGNKKRLPSCWVSVGLPCSGKSRRWPSTCSTSERWPHRAFVLRLN